MAVNVLMHVWPCESRKSHLLWQFITPTTLFQTVTMQYYQIISVVCGQHVAEIGNSYAHYVITKNTNVHVVQ
jgi:hypothetical protein